MSRPRLVPTHVVSPELVGRTALGAFASLGHAVLLVLLGAACDPAERPATSPDAASTASPLEAPSGAVAAPKHGEAPPASTDRPPALSGEQKAEVSSPPKPPARERVRLHNECAKPVKLRIERQNDSDLDTTLGSNTTTEERAKDGDEVWLRSDKNDTIDKIVVTAAMSEVTIASGCLKLGSR